MIPTNMIYVLKRSNGFFGIYVNGKEQEHLRTNSTLSMSAECLIDTVLCEMKTLVGAVSIWFTEDESEFKSNLPKLEEFVKKYE